MGGRQSTHRDMRSTSSLHDWFHAKYAGSDFSHDFLRRVEKSSKHEAADPNQVADFVLDWDERRGYDKTPVMLDLAEEELEALIRQHATSTNRDAYIERMRKFQKVLVDGDNAFRVVPYAREDHFRDQREESPMLSSSRGARDRSTFASGNGARDRLYDDNSSAFRRRIFRTPAGTAPNAVDTSTARGGFLNRGQEELRRARERAENTLRPAGGMRPRTRPNASGPQQSALNLQYFPRDVRVRIRDGSAQVQVVRGDVDSIRTGTYVTGDGVPKATRVVMKQGQTITLSQPVRRTARLQPNHDALMGLQFQRVPDKLCDGGSNSCEVVFSFMSPPDQGANESAGGSDEDIQVAATSRRMSELLKQERQFMTDRYTNTELLPTLRGVEEI